MGLKMKEFKPTAIFFISIIVVMAIVTSCFVWGLVYDCVNEGMKVEDVIEKAECDYIIKDLQTWSILDPDTYKNYDVESIMVCCDTEDTICIFISVPIEEEKVIDKRG